MQITYGLNFGTIAIMTSIINAEFHCHTIYSKDSLTKPAELVKTCRQKGIDRVIVTDHNTIAGAVAAKAIDPERVIIGEEIMTQQGELLAAYLKDEVPPGLSARDTIARLREQDAFISVAHPFDLARRGHWTLADLCVVAPMVDAIETFNARCFPPRFNYKAAAFARERHLPETVGSDAHATFELGRATLRLPAFHDAESLRRALPHASQQVVLSMPWVRLSSRYAVLFKMLSKRIRRFRLDH